MLTCMTLFKTSTKRRADRATRRTRNRCPPTASPPSSISLSPRRRGLARLSPLTRRLIAPDPGALTFTGTCSYIVGEGEVAIIDPGPAISSHIDALLKAVAGEVLAAILVTHTHRDHSPGRQHIAGTNRRAGRRLRALRGARRPSGPRPRRLARPRLCARSRNGGRRTHRSWRRDDRGRGDCRATPPIICASRCARSARFSPAIMSWPGRPSVARPTAPCATTWRRSKSCGGGRTRSIGRRMADPCAIRDAICALSHITAPSVRRRSYTARRGRRTIPQMVAHIYEGVDARLHGAAALTVFAHIEDLIARGLVQTDGPADFSARYVRT